MKKYSENYIKSEYDFGIYGDEKSTYVKQDIKIKGRDENLVRETAEKMRSL